MPEDVRPSEAEPMIFPRTPRTPDEPLVVDVTRGLDSGSMREQAHLLWCLLFVLIRHGLSYGAYFLYWCLLLVLINSTRALGVYGAYFLY